MAAPFQRVAAGNERCRLLNLAVSLLPLRGADFYKIHHLHAHHHFAVLIDHLDECAADAAVGARFRAARLHYGGAYGELVAGTYGLVPAQLIAAGRAEIGDMREIILRIDPHHQCRGLPTAGDQTSVNTLSRRFLRSEENTSE